MDNCIFASAGAHLARCQPCAPRPAPVVARAGTKTAHRPFLWISPRLCQNYPQFYAPRASAAGNGPKTKGSATASCPECSSINSKRGKPCSFSLAARVRAKTEGLGHACWLRCMGCPRWLEHCIRWCGVKGIGPQQPLLLQPLKGVSDPPDRTAGPGRYFSIPAAMACLSGCPVGR